jgi:segregation and condensation protein B
MSKGTEAGMSEESASQSMIDEGPRTGLAPAAPVEVVGRVAAEPPEALPELTPRLLGAVEAVLMSTDRPLPLRKLAEAIGLIAPEADHAPAALAEGEQGAEPAAPPKPRKRGKSSAEREASEGARAEALIERLIAELNIQYQRSSRSFRIESIAGGFRVMTLPEHAWAIESFRAQRASGKLSRAGIETLAIIAYKQPITRAELEAIRGVACGEVLKSLMERRMVTIKGRAEELGRPMLYGTTKAFLDAFGLASLKDLPTLQELKLS